MLISEHRQSKTPNQLTLSWIAFNAAPNGDGNGLHGASLHCNMKVTLVLLQPLFFVFSDIFVIVVVAVVVLIIRLFFRQA